MNVATLSFVQLAIVMLATISSLIILSPRVFVMNNPRGYKIVRWILYGAALFPLIARVFPLQTIVPPKFEDETLIAGASFALLVILKYVLHYHTDVHEPRSLAAGFIWPVVVLVLLTFVAHFAEKHAREWMEAQVISWTGMLASFVWSVLTFFWIASILHAHLTKIEEYSSRAAWRFIRNPFAKFPFQICMIGPKGSGKTKIAYALAQLDHRQVDHSGRQDTHRIASMPEGVVIDLPGENLAQHLAAAMRYRSDVLCLVTNTGTISIRDLAFCRDFRTFIEDAMTGIPNDKYPKRAWRYNYDSTDATAPPARSNAAVSKTYFNALYLATRQSRVSDANNLPLTLRFTAKAFLLIFYNDSPVPDWSDSDAVEKKLSTELKAVAEEIGGFFKVPPPNCDYRVLHVDINDRGAVQPRYVVEKISEMLNKTRLSRV